VVINNSSVSSNASLGPFAFVREGTCIDSNAFVGKFVEIKKSTIGEGSKVPHLSYIGDATIGKDTNIGAGTITCNYDGKQKNRTVIGDNCFIGSDTMLVAPVKLEDETFTAAGSVITHDVPSGSLAVSRTRQKNIEGWTKRKDCTDKRRK
jgi:bifunctional UDP-N-acetylglucosamine pyrophosphorylase/glucosamine-1-phosphate N-acetyltransferase